MEIAHAVGLPELGMEDPNFLNQLMSSLDDFSAMPLFSGNLQHSFSCPTYNLKSYMGSTHTDNNRPIKQLKANSWSSYISNHVTNSQAAASPTILSFDNPNSLNQVTMLTPKEELMSPKGSALTSNDLLSQGSFGSQNDIFRACQGAERTSPRAKSSYSRDHIIAERKRRENLSQKFIALSALVPGLKKTDKISVLGDAIKYLKHLEERVKMLEEQSRKKTVDSVIFVKKSQLFADSENSCSDENSFEAQSQSDQALPEIEARFSEKNVLIRIHCEKKKEVLEKTVGEIEKLHLTVFNSSAMTFGTSVLDITIIAQMDSEFNMTVKDLVKSLRLAFQKFM